MKTKTPKQRTEQQNRAAHKFFRNLAVALDELGYEQTLTIGSVTAPWTEETAKDLFRTLGYKLYRKKSTADLTTTEMTAIYDLINRELTKRGKHVPWPSMEELMWKERMGS